MSSTYSGKFAKRAPSQWLVVLWTLAVVVATSTAAMADQAPPRFVGQPLSEALATLQADGLRIFFTSKVVRPDMRVSREPRASETTAILQELLSEHGLVSQAGPGGRLMIVEAGPTGIRGLVRDRRSARLLTEVSVVQVDRGTATRRVVSDASGRFRMEAMEAGDYVLEAHSPGYVVERLEGVRVEAHGLTEVVFELQATLLAVDEIVVTPSRVSLLSSEPVAALDLDRSEILALPHLGDDIFRALTLLPGVSGEEASARFNVRGGRDDEVLVLLDRIELYEPYHLKDFSSSVSIIPPRALQEVNLLTGGFSARYGDRMGGVLEMTTQRPRNQRTTLGLSILNAEVGGAGSFADERGHWLGSLRRGALDLTLDFIGQKQKPLFWDAFGRVDFQLRDDHWLAMHVLHSDDRLDALLFEPDTIENFLTGYKNSYLWLGHQGLMGSELFVDSTFSLGRVERDRRGNETEFEGGSFDVRDERRLDVVGFKQDWSYQASERSFWTWGFDGRFLRTEYDYRNFNDFGDALVDIRDQPRPMVTLFQEVLQGESYSLYATDRWRLRDPLTLELGLRFDRHTLTDDSDISPRFNLVYAPGKASTFRLAWGLFHQSQRAYELQVADGETRLAGSERTAQSVVGFEHSFSVGRRKSPLLLRLEAYHRRVRDPRSRFENLFEPISEFPEIEADRLRFAPESSEAYGVEALLKGSVGPKVDWWVTYAYARTTDRIGGRNVPRRIDQPHTLNFDINYRLGEHWNLNVAWRYHTGWPITGVTGRLVAEDPEDGMGDEDDGDEGAGEEAVEGDDGELEIVPVYGPLNGERLPDYHRLDLRASRQWQLRRGVFGFFLEVQNVYDRGNLAGFEFDFDFEVTPEGDLKLQPVEEIWGGILPSFGITWEF